MRAIMACEKIFFNSKERDMFPLAERPREDRDLPPHPTGHGDYRAGTTPAIITLDFPATKWDYNNQKFRMYL
jgi:hypothetical protein